MPVIASAAKKLRQSRKRESQNKVIKKTLQDLLAAFKKQPTPKVFSSLTSAFDKAVKARIIHQNKAARLKSRLSKLISSKVAPKNPWKKASK